MKPKFQPSPSRISDVQNCHSAMPDSATTAQPISSSRPNATIRSLPKRAISRPVKKLGPNIAMTCQEMPSVAWSGEKPQPTMASGAPVMTKLIRQ